MNDDQALMAGLLTEQEMEQLISVIAEARGERGFTEQEAQDLITWARWVRFWHASLNLALKGEALLDIDAEGEAVLVARPEQQ